MMLMERGGYRAFMADTPQDLRAAQALRARCFGLAGTADSDPMDAASTHVLIRETATGTVVGCFRMLEVHGAQIVQSYAGALYDLTALTAFEGPMLELGRFCIDPDCADPDVLRLAWATLTAQVDARQIRLLFGCTSFQGTNPAAHGDALAWLGAHHAAPADWAPRIKARDHFALAGYGTADAGARRQLPPLLQTYLMMGAWVSDHGVTDRRMNTLHVFTGLEIDAIPAARKRLLRAL